MNRKISLSIEDIYIKYAGEAFGATGSHNALTLRMIFGSAWDGMAKTAYFTDALGSASVSIVLGLDKLVGGAYEVDVPSEALKYAGEATVTIKGVLTSGNTTTKAMTTAAGHFRVLDSELPESVGNAGTITASDKEQLQAEIAALEPMFTAYKQAAETAAANAKTSENNAKVSEETAGAASISAASSKAAAADSANAAAESAASARSDAGRAETARTAAETAAAGIVTDEAARVEAEAGRVQAEIARRSAESARQTAEANRAEAETARNVWEDYDGTTAYKAGNKVYWQGSSYVCLQDCKGITPENGLYWQLVVRSGFASDSAFGFDVVNGRLLCYYSGDNPPPFRLGSDGHLYVDLDKSYDLGKVTGSGGAGSISMRTADGYIQYSTDDGETWENLIALAELKGEPGQDGAGMDVTGASAGQIAKITTVDENGKPTAWEPADLPSGGGGDWVFAGSVTAESAGMALKVSNIHAKHILVSLYASCDDTSSRGYNIVFNDVLHAQHANSLSGNSVKHLWAVEFDLLAAGDENYIYSRVWPNETHHTNTSNDPQTIMNTTTLSGTMWYKVGISEFNSVAFACMNGTASAGNIMNVWYR